MSMKKILVTENQLNMIKSNLNETINNSRYEREVSVNVESYRTKFNGQDIDWVTSSNITLTYLIEQEHRSWGIKNISLYDIQGPSEIEITVTPMTDEQENVDVVLPINWESIETETQESEGVITIGHEITVVLGNGPNGELIISSVHVPVYTL